MNYASIARLIALCAACTSLSGCAALTILSYSEKGFYSDHGKGENSSLYNSNDACSLYGTCGGGNHQISSCDLYGNC